MGNPVLILKKARKARGLSQEAIAETLGISLRMYQRYEIGLFPKYKSENIKAIDKILHTNLFGIVYGNNIQHSTSENLSNKLKIDIRNDYEGITFVPIEFQSGYSKKFMTPSFGHSLQKLIIPGLPYRGESFRIFEMEGDSMSPTFKEHFHLLTERVDQYQWKNIKDYYAYVLVTDVGILIKRIFKMNDRKWVLSSDNENLYPQFIQPVQDIKELWFIKRKMNWEMVPPSKFNNKIKYIAPENENEIKDVESADLHLE